MIRPVPLLALLALTLPLSGCIVYDVAEFAVGTVTTVAGVGVKAVGAAAGAVIPDDDDEEDEKARKKKQEKEAQRKQDAERKADAPADADTAR